MAVAVSMIEYVQSNECLPVLSFRCMETQTPGMTVMTRNSLRVRAFIHRSLMMVVMMMIILVMMISADMDSWHDSDENSLKVRAYTHRSLMMMTMVMMFVCWLVA